MEETQAPRPTLLATDVDAARLIFDLTQTVAGMGQSLSPVGPSHGLGDDGWDYLYAASQNLAALVSFERNGDLVAFEEWLAEDWEEWLACDGDPRFGFEPYIRDEAKAAAWAAWMDSEGFGE